MNAVRVIAAGDTLLAPSITRRLIDDYTQRPPPGSRSPAEFAALTDRELDVLTLVGEGLSNGEIADRLYLSEATIKTHINHIFSKLTARDRVQLVIAAYESGLIRPGGPHAQGSAPT